jgi:hypothetical protein
VGRLHKYVAHHPLSALIYKSHAIFEVCRVILKADLLPPSYFDPKRTLRKGTGAPAPVILPESKPSVSTATVATKVLHPRVLNLIRRDLMVMSLFCSSHYPLSWYAMGFGRMMYGQLGLSQNPIISSLSYRFQTAIPLELLLKNGGGPYGDQLAELGLDAFLVRERAHRSVRTCCSWISLIFIMGTWSSFPDPLRRFCSKRFGHPSSPATWRS